MKHLGLDDKEAAKLLKIHGYNQIKEQKKRSVWLILWQQVKGNFMFYFMVLASILSFSVEKTTTGYAILGVIVIIVVVGFIQEYKAEKAISALKNMLESFSTVLRNGVETQINSKNLVPGDIILLETGEKIPADCVLLEAKDMMINESILTGESKEISKNPLKTLKSDPEKENLIYMGTYIINGRGIAKIIKTGMNTEFGKIAGMISSAEKELPLKTKINVMVKFMAAIAIIVALIIGIIMFLNIDTPSNENIIEIVIVVIAIMISAFPEGLPVVLISTLAGGAYKMAQKKAIVNRMSIIETLGETTIICSDKTGTITKGEMTAKELFTYENTLTITGVGYDTNGEFYKNDKKVDPNQDHTTKKLLQGIILCNNAHTINYKGGTKFKGTGTEIALIVLGHKANTTKQITNFERLEEMPFNSERKMMSVIVDENGEKVLYSKGASEFFLKHCTHIQTKDGILPLGKKELLEIETKIKNFTQQKYRVLCVGYKKIQKDTDPTLEENIIFLGAVGLQDAPRDGVKESIQSCYDAGIKVMMITGDNKDTALAIANDIGIHGEAVSGDELDKMSDEELKNKIKDIVIFARVKPEHKLRIVKSLKSLGEIVTMTGDGVNDAPALKEAHIGVAMGINGTDVSREAADLVLEDDNFVTIVSAIEEGRTIFKNIQKFVVYQLSCNIAELSLLFFAVIIGLPAPFIAIQILFMNLVTDNLPALTLGFTKGSGYIMKLKARRNSEILNKKKKLLLIGVGLFMALASLLVYIFALKVLQLPLLAAQTLTLLTLIMFEVTNAFNFRSLYSTFLKIKRKRNTTLIYAGIISIIATLAITYIPGLQKIFGTTSLPWYFWIITFILSLSIILVVDFAKRLDKSSFEDYKTTP